MTSEDQVTMAHERTVLAGERTVLANERTFSAWIRTGLANVGGGVAIIRLLIFHNPTHLFLAQVIGCVLILLGIAIFLMAYLDYKKGHEKLQMHSGYAGSMWAVTGIVTVLVFISVTLLLISFTGSWN